MSSYTINMPIPRPILQTGGNRGGWVNKYTNFNSANNPEDPENFYIINKSTEPVSFRRVITGRYKDNPDTPTQNGLYEVETIEVNALMFYCESVSISDTRDRRSGFGTQDSPWIDLNTALENISCLLESSDMCCDAYIYLKVTGVVDYFVDKTNPFDCAWRVIINFGGAEFLKPIGKPDGTGTKEWRYLTLPDECYIQNLTVKLDSLAFFSEYLKIKDSDVYIIYTGDPIFDKCEFEWKSSIKDIDIYTASGLQFIDTSCMIESVGANIISGMDCPTRFYDNLITDENRGTPNCLYRSAIIDCTYVGKGNCGSVGGLSATVIKGLSHRTSNSANRAGGVSASYIYESNVSVSANHILGSGGVSADYAYDTTVSVTEEWAGAMGLEISKLAENCTSNVSGGGGVIHAFGTFGFGSKLFSNCTASSNFTKYPHSFPKMCEGVVYRDVPGLTIEAECPDGTIYWGLGSVGKPGSPLVTKAISGQCYCYPVPASNIQLDDCSLSLPLENMYSIYATRDDTKVAVRFSEGDYR